MLVHTVPWHVKGWVEQRFAGTIVESTRQGTNADGQTYVSHYAVRLRACMNAGIPLGVLGEVWVEAGC